MFHQIRIEDVHQEAQRCLWRAGIDEPMHISKMRVITFGAA